MAAGMSGRLPLDQLFHFWPEKIEREHGRENRADVAIRDSLRGLDLCTLLQHYRQHAKRISLCPKKQTPFPMSQAKVTKRTKFLDNFVMRESKHQSQRHIFHPNELEVPCVIVDVEVAQTPSRRMAAW